MNKQQAQQIIRDTFENAFDKSVFTIFIKNLLNRIDESKAFHVRGDVKEMFRNVIRTYERIGTFETPDNEKIDIIVVYLQKGYSLDHARVTQRNFAGGYLVGRGEKDAGLFAYVSPDEEDWRFSLVKMDYKFEKTKTGKVKVKEEFTPARRWSFLVGENEGSHTAQSRLVKILANDEQAPTLKEIENAFDIETVTKEFFLKYRELFLRTKEELDRVVNKDPKIKADFEAKGVDTVNFTKKLLGQIVFLYFLQKKGWFGVGRDDDWGTGSKHFLRELFEGKKHSDYNNFFNDILEPLFYDALRNDRSHDDGYYSRFNCKIPFLNGGLFDPIGNYDWVHTDILLPNTLFSNKNKTKEGDTGDGILDIFDRYNFTVKEDEPLEKEVAIDPELLGKAYEKFNAIRPDNYDEFKKALKSGKKGDENKFNKKFGVYYTPREIVHYMCQQSLINYLHSVTQASQPDPKSSQIDHSQDSYATISKEDIETLIHFGEHISENEARVVNKGKETKTYSHKLPESIRSNAALIDEKLADITVCDPAVGSGAFPVGMMSEIVKIRNVLSTFLPVRGTQTGVTENTWTPYEFKRRCIEHSLYGVDIDPGAVEIAKLRLWLSLVVDEEDIKNIKPLPNLDYKIVRGNSLIGFPENWESPISKEIEDLKNEFFSETNPSKKTKLKKHIDDKWNNRYENSLKTFGYEIDFDFKMVFSEVFHEKASPERSRRGGFDVVICNPPYVRMELIKDQKSELKALYPDVFDGRADLFVYFYARGLGLLHYNGVLSFISSNKYMRAGYGKGLRRYMSQKTTLQNVLDFGDLPIFEAIAYPSIVITLKSSPPAWHETKALKVEDMETLEHLDKDASRYSWTIPQISMTPKIWMIESRSVIKLIEKVRSSGKPLGDVVQGKFYMGVKTGLNEAFVINENIRHELIVRDRKSMEIIKPWLRGRDIKRWKIDSSGLYVLFTYHGVKISDYPAVQDYLMQYKKQLEKRSTSNMHAWYELQQPQMGIYADFDKPKIVWPDIAPTCYFTLDDKQYYADMTMFVMPRDDYYLLGILNSKLSEWFIKQISSTIQQGFVRFKRAYVSQIPIAAPPSEELTTIKDLALRLLATPGQATQVNQLEREIDQVVYQLYGLTPEEIEIIEGSVKL